MPKVHLSDASLRSFIAEKQTDFWDENLPAFGVRVSKAGTKTFVLNQDKTRKTIGRYPALSLAEARTEAKRLMAERTLGRIRPQSITFEAAVKVFLEEKGERRRTRTVKDHSRHLNLLNFKCQLADVSHHDMERKLKRLPPSEFNHRLACAKTFFTWAQKKRYITDNPTVGLSPHTTTPRSRILTDEELKAVWKAAEHCGQFGVIVRLLICTGQRRGEIAALQRDWISDGQISLPANIAKNGRLHTFPIGSLVVSLLNLFPKTNSCSQMILFPARGHPTRPFNGWSKSKAALDKLISSECAENGLIDWPTVHPWTLHDLRRTYRSTLPRLGVAPHIAERLVNHISSRTQMEQTYDRYQYFSEMKDAVQKHDLWLTSLLGR